MTDNQWAALLATPEPVQAWITFCHHDTPIEWTLNLQERMRHIDTEKPEHERATRRHCIMIVPEERMPSAYVTAWRDYETVRDYETAWRAYSEQRVTQRDYETACRPYVTARRAHRDALLALALEFVPDAPWDAQREELVFG